MGSRLSTRSGFTIVEVMVALVILAVGLIGMAGMTVMVMKGGRGAQDLAHATNICQQKIEELKDEAWDDIGTSTIGDGNELNWGLAGSSMMQEEDLNPQGLTWEAYCKQQVATVGSLCASQTDAACDSRTVSATCKELVDNAGPYKFTRTFVVCKGEDYTGSPTTPPSGTAMGSAANPSSFSYSAAPNCLVDPADAATRPQVLACEADDILNPGVNADEKMIKILCTWRTSDGTCHYVNFESLKMRL